MLYYAITQESRWELYYLTVCLTFKEAVYEYKEARENRLPLYPSVFLVFLIFKLYPILYTFVLSFCNMDLLSGDLTFVKLANYKRVLNSPFFYRSIGNTLLIWIMSIIPQLTLAFFLAMLMSNRWLRGRAIFRNVYFFPKVWDASEGEVAVFGTIGEMPKVSAFSFDPLVQNGELVISQDWVGLIDDMRNFYESGVDPEYGSWSGEWATAWNAGKLLFRAMPSWDFFTDWSVNEGNVGVAVPFKASFEGQTCLCVYNKSEKKDLAGAFVKFIASDEFQIANMENNNQVPASRTAIETLAETNSDPKFGGQNLIATFGEVLENVEAITPDKYTRSVQNLFQKTASNGIKAGEDNDTILANFKAALADQYPEVVIK